MGTPTFTDVLNSISSISDMDRTKSFEVTLHPNGKGFHIKYLNTSGVEWNYCDSGVSMYQGTVVTNGMLTP